MGASHSRHRRSPTRIQLTKPLFAWDCLEDSPSLKTVNQFLESIPDAKLLDELSSQRGRGRNDYPVHVLWGVVLLTHLLRHTSTDSCLAELCRNQGLRRLIGIESVTIASDLGQHDTPPFVEGMMVVADGLLETGMTREELRMLFKENPSAMVY